MSAHKPIPAGSKVKVIRGANNKKVGVVQPGKWPNKHGNYGVNIQTKEGSDASTGFWIGQDDLKAVEASKT